MRIKIYQTFFESNQYKNLDKAFIPFNNIKNAQPDLREYPNLVSLYNKNINFKGHWGMVSWRWKEKTKIEGRKFIEWIKENPGYDFYHISPFISLPTIYRNHINQDNVHPGMVDYYNKIIHHLGYSFDVRDIDYPLNLFCVCHYHVANAKFWDRWFAFFETMLAISEKDESMHNYLYKETLKHRDRQIINFPFVCERSVSLFLYLNYKEFKILHYPYQYLTQITHEKFSLVEISEKALQLRKNTIY